MQLLCLKSLSFVKTVLQVMSSGEIREMKSDLRHVYHEVDIIANSVDELFVIVKELSEQINEHQSIIEKLKGKDASTPESDKHHFLSKADAGEPNTYPQRAGAICKNGFIVIEGRPCKVVEVSTSKTGNDDVRCHFVAVDIFKGKRLEDTVPYTHNCEVPRVNLAEYKLINLLEDGFVSLLISDGQIKDDLKLPTDEKLLNQIRDGFKEGKDLVVTVESAMGEEQICAVKDIAPK